MKVYKGNIITCNNSMDTYKYLVEEYGKIVYIGNSLATRYKGYIQEDLHDKALLPCFGDSHLHFSSYALFNSTLDLRDIKDFNVLKSKLLSYYDQNKPKIILAFGISAHSIKEKTLVTKSLLDELDIDIPIMLIKYDGHASVVNSKMLNMLPKKISTMRGYFETEGQLFQEAYFAATDFVTGKVSIPALLKNMLRGIDQLADYGIGMIHTSEGIGFPLDLDISISRLLKKGLINPFQIRLFFQTMNTKKVLKRMLPRIGGCFETALDGCFGSVDAALLSPYEETDNRGILFYEDSIVEAFVKKAHREGLQIALHAIGDRAFDQALRAYEKALLLHPKEDHRHTIIHGCMISKTSLKKAGELNLIVAAQPSFIHWDLEPLSYMEDLLGERAQSLNPINSMIQSGITVSGGSDAPCTVPNPIEGIYAACNHYNKKEAISIEEALRMYTYNIAFGTFDEKERGSLEVGKYADMIILNKNPLTMNKEDLLSLEVERLLLNGKPYVKGQTIGKLIQKSLTLTKNSR